MCSMSICICLMQREIDIAYLEQKVTTDHIVHTVQDREVVIDFDRLAGFKWSEYCG